MKRLLMTVLGLAGLCLLTTGARADDREILGAGATFPYPLYSKMFDVYAKEYGIRINYQAIGSGGGIKQLASKTVDFGGSDAPMTDEETKQASAAVIHVPICLGAVVVVYNIPGNPEIKLTPGVLADMYMGTVKKWNDPKIQKLNPSVKLPDMNVVVVHRSDGSGTTFIFSDYLAKVSAEWKQKVGVGKSLNWPAGLGAKGNPGVAGLVKQVPASIGYVELIYALQNKMPFASIQNKAGKFMKPTLASTSAAANVSLPADMKVSVTDTEAPDGYSISGFTWIIAYKEQNYGGRSMERAKAVANLLRWMIRDGQKYAEPMQYAPLANSAAKKAETLVKSMTYDGQPLVK